MLIHLGTLLVALGASWVLYGIWGYPALLRLWTRRGRPADSPTEDPLPAISISVPAYNEAGQIRRTIESLLRLEYPAELRQILVISDASSDGTDDIVREYADRGVELLRLEERKGKTAAEYAAGPHLTGDIVVNTDASIRIVPGSVLELVRQFSDPTVGLASGTDVSVSPEALDAPPTESDRSEADQGGTNSGESTYVGMEMGIRERETLAGGIVGASGCFYAVRKPLHLHPIPEDLSRDFSAALITRMHGYRPVSVTTAFARVPRADSLTREYRRKVRTMSRGMRTLWHFRSLLNPREYGRFSIMLFSHKVVRWGLPWALLLGLAGLALLRPAYPLAGAILWTALSGLAVSALLWILAASGRLRGRAAVPAWVISSLTAAAHAATTALFAGRYAVWEPTRRTGERPGSQQAVGS